MDKQYRILSNQLIWAENSTDLCKYIKQFFLRLNRVSIKFQECVKKLQRLKLTHTHTHKVNGHQFKKTQILWFNF